MMGYQLVLRDESGRAFMVVEVPEETAREIGGNLTRIGLHKDGVLVTVDAFREAFGGLERKVGFKFEVGGAIKIDGPIKPGHAFAVFRDAGGVVKFLGNSIPIENGVIRLDGPAVTL